MKAMRPVGKFREQDCSQSGFIRIHVVDIDNEFEANTITNN